MKVSDFLGDNNPRYVDIIVGENVDVKRFVDIYTILHVNKNDDGYEYKQKIVNKVKTYFDELLSAVQRDDVSKIDYLSKNVHEAKYTGLGFSTSGSGKGFGKDKFNSLVQSIKNSEAYKSGTISDILDVELYVDNIGVDTLSDLVTNLIQDVLSEYTEKKVQNLSKNNHLIYSDLHYWDAESRTWQVKKLPVICYKNLADKDMYYLLVPYCLTSSEKCKVDIFNQIFDKCIRKVFERIILSDKTTYGGYIHELKTGEPVVYKKRIVKLINAELGEGCAKKGNGYVTSKGLLALINSYDEIKDFIDSEIKKDFN